MELVSRPQSRPLDIARQPTVRLWAGPVAAEPDETRTGAASKDPGRCPRSPLLAGYGRSDHGFRPVRRLSKQDDDQKHGPSEPYSYHSRARCAPGLNRTTGQASNQVSNYHCRSQWTPVDVSGPVAAAHSYNPKAQASTKRFPDTEEVRELATPKDASRGRRTNWQPSKQRINPAGW